MNARSILHSSFAVVLILSLAYSLAIQYGHADTPVADMAAEINPLGVGDAAPRFIVATVDGEQYDFDPQRLERPAILLTYRGGWCPYCNMYLSDMRHVIPEIKDQGIDVLFLSGDRPELLYKSLKQETQDDIDGLGYTILSDANAQAAIALGIAFKASQRTLDILERKGRDTSESSIEKHGILPVPSVFAIDRDGTIQFAYTNADYKVRLPAEDLLAAAGKIAATE